MLVDGRTRTEIWSMPERVMCRAGQDATYALMGGWWEICSVRYATRRETPAAVDMDVGGEVVEAETEPEPDSAVLAVEARERFESWAETFDSTTVDGDLFTVGEDQPFMESRLPIAPTRPDLSEPLIVPASEWERCGLWGASMWVVMIGVRSSGSYEIGGTSQCMRKFSPRTELYGLQGLPRWWLGEREEKEVKKRAVAGQRRAGNERRATYDVPKIFRKGET